MFNPDHLVNPALMGLARENLSRLGGFQKRAFIPGGDPGMGGGGGGGGAPPGGDPSGGGGGGAPPGGDPSGGGGGDPSGGGGGGGDPAGDQIAQLTQQVQQMQQQMMALQQQGGGGGAGGGSGGGLKPKIDVNVELMQIKNIMAKVCDHLGIHVPAQDMVATPDKLNAMAGGGNPASGAQPGGGGAGGAPAIGGIDPMGPMPGAGTPGAGGEKAGSASPYRGNGVSFDTTGFGNNMDKAAAILSMRAARHSNNGTSAADQF